MAVSNHSLYLFLSRMNVLMVEKLGYKINMFNAAVDNALVIKSERVMKMAGGIEMEFYFDRAKNIITRRDPNGMRPLELVTISQKSRNRIRLAWTTNMLDMTRAQFDWIGENPSAAAVVFAESMSTEILQNYLKRVFGVLRATVGSNPKTMHDAYSKVGDKRRRMSYANLELAADLFGDASSQIQTWIMPTTARTQLLLGNLSNKENLFTFGTVNVMRDASNRAIITTDDPNLRETTSQGDNAWLAYGLTQNSVVIEELDDFDEAMGERTGFENIQRTYQANWSTRFSVKGYKFDETLLQQADYDGQDPYVSASDGAIMTAANWSVAAGSHKETAGVGLRVVGDLFDYQD